MQKKYINQLIIGNEFIKDNWQYILIILIALVFLTILIIVILPYFKKRREAKSSLKIDQDYLENIVKALGGKNNIVSSELNNKRLHVLLKNSKSIDAQLLNKLELAAVLTKNQIKILVKYDNNTINKYLNSLNKGEENE